MVLRLEEYAAENNGAMVYIIDRKRIPKGIKVPNISNASWRILTVGSIRGLKVRRSDRKLIVTDISNHARLCLVLTKLKKIMNPNGYTSIAIVKQGSMSYNSFYNSVKNILGNSMIDIETYNA